MSRRAAPLALSTKEVITALEKMYENQRARCESEIKSAVKCSSSSGTMPAIFDLLTDSLSARPTAVSSSLAQKEQTPNPTKIDEKSNQEQQQGMAACEEQETPTYQAKLGHNGWQILKRMNSLRGKLKRYRRA
jgi:hypothetical protein